MGLPCVGRMSGSLPTLPYFEGSGWKVADVVAIKIEEHQLLGSREGLGVDGPEGITLQNDALHLWDCSQSIGLQVSDTILTFTPQGHIRHWPISTCNDPFLHLSDLR